MIQSITTLKLSEKPGAAESADRSGGNDGVAPNQDLVVLVERVRDGDTAAVSELYHRFHKMIRFMIFRRLGHDADCLEDKVHDVFMIVVGAIREGTLRDACRLPGFIQTITVRKAAETIRGIQVKRREVGVEAPLVLLDPTPSAEELALRHERRRIMVETLQSMSARDREVLTRFYLDEQPAERICTEMGLSMKQFGLLKSRAKARFGEAARSRMRPNPLRPVRSAIQSVTARPGKLALV
jgi:RNA polymerase sigma-70 factor, ECF subfamily